MKKFLSLVLALVMTMSLVTIGASAKDFTDDSTIKYDEAVDVISAIGVVDGYADGAFKPTATLTRGAAAKIICNMILGPTTAAALSADSAPFSDVASNHTFAGYIAYCAKEGIINGYADGTFRPAGTLTGYAFMKMLLGALGYDADIEGYTGANWSIQVAKRAINIGLDDGNDEFVGTKAVTREEACLYAFNALQADMVEYKDKTSIIIGDVSVVTNADATKTGKTFAETYFSKLKVTEGDEDEFGRPATTWTWKSKEIGTYADKADATYTAQFKIKDLYSDLNLEKSFDADVVLNGEELDEGFAITKTDTTKQGANGLLTEVYLEKKDTKDSDKITGVKVVQINTYIGEVVDVDEKDDERYIDIKCGALKTTLSYTTEEFEEDDMVLFTVSYKDEDDGEVQSVALAEKQTGTLTKTVGAKYTIDGETYSKSAKCEAGTLKVKEDVEYYMDAYGYIIKIDLTKDEITVDDLAYVLAAEDGGKLDNNRAKLLFADGSKKTVVTDEDYTDLEESIVSFDVNDDEEYELTKVAQKDATVTKGSPKVATGVTANSKTIYVYSVKDEDGKTTVDTYTGYKNAPTVKEGAKDAVVYYDKDNKAVLVYVISDSAYIDETSSNEELTFIAVKANGDITDDGSSTKYYSFSAVVDGEITTLDVKVGATNLAAGTGVQAFKGYNTNKNGVVTSLTVSDKLVTSKSTTIATDDGVITIGGEPFAYADDVLVLVVDDNKFEASDVDSIKTKAGAYTAIQYTLDDDDAIDVIILTKK